MSLNPKQLFPPFQLFLTMLQETHKKTKVQNSLPSSIWFFADRNRQIDRDRKQKDTDLRTCGRKIGRQRQKVKRMHFLSFSSFCKYKQLRKSCHVFLVLGRNQKKNKNTFIFNYVWLQSLFLNLQKVQTCVKIFHVLTKKSTIQNIHINSTTLQKVEQALVIVEKNEL